MTFDLLPHPSALLALQEIDFVYKGLAVMCFRLNFPVALGS